MQWQLWNAVVGHVYSKKIVSGLFTIPPGFTALFRSYSCFSADWPQGGLEVPCTYNSSLCTMPFLCGSHHNKILAEVKFGG